MFLSILFHAIAPYLQSARYRVDIQYRAVEKMTASCFQYIINFPLSPCRHLMEDLRLWGRFKK